MYIIHVHYMYMYMYIALCTIDGWNFAGYQVQVLPTRGSGDWRSINATPSKGTSFRVPNLIEGADYEFRVVAVNDA